VVRCVDRAAVSDGVDPLRDTRSVRPTAESRDEDSSGETMEPDAYIEEVDDTLDSTIHDVETLLPELGLPSLLDPLVPEFQLPIEVEMPLESELLLDVQLPSEADIPDVNVPIDEALPDPKELPAPEQIAPTVEAALPLPTALPTVPQLFP
jgi:hypothetical protein